MGNPKGETSEYARLAKEIRSVRMTGDGVVSVAPGFLFDIIFYAEAGAGQFNLYDGDDASGTVILSSSTLQNNTIPIHFDPPMYYREGLYVDVSVNVTAITLRFADEPFV